MGRRGVWSLALGSRIGRRQSEVPGHSAGWREPASRQNLLVPRQAQLARRRPSVGWGGRRQGLPVPPQAVTRAGVTPEAKIRLVCSKNALPRALPALEIGLPAGFPPRTRGGAPETRFHPTPFIRGSQALATRSCLAPHNACWRVWADSGESLVGSPACARGQQRCRKPFTSPGTPRTASSHCTRWAGQAHCAERTQTSPLPLCCPQLHLRPQPPPCLKRWRRRPGGKERGGPAFLAHLPGPSYDAFTALGLPKRPLIPCYRRKDRGSERPGSLLWVTSQSSLVVKLYQELGSLVLSQYTLPPPWGRTEGLRHPHRQPRRAPGRLRPQAAHPDPGSRRLWCSQVSASCVANGLFLP